MLHSWTETCRQMYYNERKQTRIKDTGQLCFQYERNRQPTDKKTFRAYHIETFTEFRFGIVQPVCCLKYRARTELRGRAICQPIETIMQTSAFELSEYWETKTTDKTKLVDWIDLVAEHAKRIQDAKHLNIKEILTKLTLK
ncbi:protein of unknown function [Candidatus Nitrosacidococcus tergens]|uniref:Uncharacterized protein n=2 Tax=Candidatus Nitrosacidococcus tergens TaxID=553981 RepID=A0A7G1QA51_9GAMM|nr:protein of unknown function [Candidatus Nitrosacidococcus tergens]